MYRFRGDGGRRLEFLLVHPGGPYFAGRDEGVWSVPKGEPDPGEDDLLAVARREFREETGFDPGDRQFLELSPVRQKNGKVVYCWAFEGDCDPSALASNTCVIEWPPRSGRRMEIPEVDRAAFFEPDEAMRRINPAQVPLIREVVERVGRGDTRE